MSNKLKSHASPTPNAFDWGALEDLGGEDGEIKPLPDTVPMDLLENISTDVGSLGERATREQRLERIVTYISHLKPDLREVISARYGLDGGGIKTFSQIEEELGLGSLSDARVKLLDAEKGVRIQAAIDDHPSYTPTSLARRYVVKGTYPSELPVHTNT